MLNCVKLCYIVLKGSYLHNVRHVNVNINVLTHMTNHEPVLLVFNILSIDF